MFRLSPWLATAHWGWSLLSQRHGVHLKKAMSRAGESEILASALSLPPPLLFMRKRENFPKTPGFPPLFSREASACLLLGEALTMHLTLACEGSLSFQVVPVGWGWTKELKSRTVFASTLRPAAPSPEESRALWPDSNISLKPLNARQMLGELLSQHLENSFLAVPGVTGLSRNIESSRATWATDRSQAI